MSRFASTIASILLTAACGGGTFERPLPVQIEGLSARAEVLVLKAFPGSTGQTCQGVTLESAARLSAPHTAEWKRATKAPRSLELPPIEEASVTIVAYSIDASGKTIQFLCDEVTFEDIGELQLGVLTLTLSRRVEVPA